MIGYELLDGVLAIIQSIALCGLIILIFAIAAHMRGKGKR